MKTSNIETQTDEQRTTKLEAVDELIDSAKDKIFDAKLILSELGLETLGNDAGNISCSLDELSALVCEEMESKSLEKGDTQS